MFREPSGADKSTNNAIKDPSAAARSSIRRQSTIRRPSRFGGSDLRSATLRSRFPRPIADEIEREVNGFRHHVRSPAPNSGPVDDPFDLTRGLVDSNRREAGQRLLRDAIHHNHPGRRLRIPRESPMVDFLSRFSPGDDPGNRQSPEHPAYTPRFAPAYHSTASSQPHPDVIRLSPFPRFGGPGDDPDGLTVPLLRRVGQRSINEANRVGRGPVVDGLGDRQRSLSPEDDEQEHDAWETLLTTIAPDANLPSADSSFGSTTASGANASREGTSGNSANPSQTLPSSLDPTAATVRMVLDPYPEFLNPCDPPSSDSGSDSESELSQQALNQRYRARMRLMNPIRQMHNLHSTMDSRPPIPTVSFSFSDTSTDPDFTQMQAILDRLARRQDIPDEWWAAAGLSRSLGRRLGPGDEIPDSDDTDGPARQRP